MKKTILGFSNPDHLEKVNFLFVEATAAEGGKPNHYGLNVPKDKLILSVICSPKTKDEAQALVGKEISIEQQIVGTSIRSYVAGERQAANQLGLNRAMQSRIQRGAFNLTVGLKILQAAKAVNPNITAAEIEMAMALGAGTAATAPQQRQRTRVLGGQTTLNERVFGLDTGA